MSKKIRTLQVYSAMGGNPYSMIRLVGKWLEDAGFTPGDYIKVVVDKNQLTIHNTGMNSYDIKDQT